MGKMPFCKSAYLPKLKVRFGDEINKNNKLINSTSIVDEVILYSPKTLSISRPTAPVAPKIPILNFFILSIPFYSTATSLTLATIGISSILSNNSFKLISICIISTVVVMYA